MTNKYESPLSSRYASEYMLKLFSADTRYSTWRKLWVSLAKAEKKMGLNITDEQIEELSAHIYDIDYEVERAREAVVRHDVMAHIYAYGLSCPKAAGIIHLGATSCYVTDNADLVIYRDGLLYIKNQLKIAIAKIAAFCDTYKDVPTLGYTHYQPAQLVTVGKRASLWLQDFMSDLEEIDFAISNIKFLGCRGTTGTEASFMELFDGDERKIDKMNELIAKDFGFDVCFDVCGQTYPRKLDSRILNALASIAQTAYKTATDIRLLQHDRQIDEPSQEKQVGSSAMAYKRNPMMCERVCSLSRYLMVDSENAGLTASTQWLERTLDDSANRRISMPEAFLAADAVLRLIQTIFGGIRVNQKVIEKSVKEYMPFIATENILMEAVKKGGDRQKVHEVIREASMIATQRLKDGEEGRLFDELAKSEDIMLSKDELESVLDPNKYIGRCVTQTENLVKKAKAMTKDMVETEEKKVSL